MDRSSRHSCALGARLDTKTTILGPEWDQQLAARLRVALRLLGAMESGRQWGVAGSQEVLHSEYLFESQRIHVEAETYIGLSLSGPATLVDRIVSALDRAAPPT